MLSNLALDQEFNILLLATHAPPQKDVPMVQYYYEEETEVWKKFLVSNLIHIFKQVSQSILNVSPELN